jgi:hypothetical protein
MSKFTAGDQVVAVKEIGGFLRDHIPKGSRGVVSEAGWGQPTKVLFTVKGGFWSGDKRVEITVEEDEIA